VTTETLPRPPRSTHATSSSPPSIVAHSRGDLRSLRIAHGTPRPRTSQPRSSARQARERLRRAGPLPRGTQTTPAAGRPRVSLVRARPSPEGVDRQTFSPAAETRTAHRLRRRGRNRSARARAGRAAASHFRGGQAGSDPPRRVDGLRRAGPQAATSAGAHCALPAWTRETAQGRRRAHPQARGRESER